MATLDPEHQAASSAVAKRSWWGWGWEESGLSAGEQESLASRALALLGVGGLEVHSAPEISDLDLRTPRVLPPVSLAGMCSSDRRDRAAHAHGKAYRDIVRNLLGQLDNPPDVVAYPISEAEVAAVLEWCVDAGLAAIPYGGGSSVVGGVEARVGDGYPGAVSIDLTAMDRVLEVEPQSRAARIQAGALGPVLEQQLRPHGLTLRHFPQSFEFSTLGGWLATRSGGHFATLYTHIDDLTESIRAVTPSGLWESLRLPSSGSGPSPDGLLLGSEGTLGIITEAWMRLQPRPRWRASASVRFTDFDSGVEATRVIGQAALYPTNCRLLDGGEAALAAEVVGVGALLVLGFESADHPVEPWMSRALEVCRDHHGVLPDGVRYSDEGEGGAAATGLGAAGAWRNAFIRAPYLRDALIRRGLLVETFETVCTWDRFQNLHANAVDGAQRAVQEICGGGLVTCRFTHLYPDGPAPYFSILAPARWGDQVRQWDEIKAAVSEIVNAGGGAITHHHAVGRDHRPWYDRQRPDAFAASLRAAKAMVDPRATLNPGVLVDP